MNCLKTECYQILYFWSNCTKKSFPPTPNIHSGITLFNDGSFNTHFLRFSDATDTVTQLISVFWIFLLINFLFEICKGRVLIFLRPRSLALLLSHSTGPSYFCYSPDPNYVFTAPVSWSRFLWPRPQYQRRKYQDMNSC